MKICCSRCPDGGPRATRMPAEDDYSQRRQLILQHTNNGTSSPLPLGNVSSSNERYHSPVPAVCPAGCTGNDRLQTNSQERLPGTDTRSTNPNERIYTNTEINREGERSHHSTLDRHHGEQRYHGQSSERLLTERLQTSGTERYATERHRYSQPDRFQQVPNINSLDRYGSLGTNISATDRYQNTHDERSSSSNRSLDRYATTERYPKEHNTESQMYQHKITQPQTQTTERFPERYSSRYQDRFQSNDYQQERYNCERYNIPQNQERNFSSQERIPFPQVPYIPPPSPAPASDRFIPPPPLSPANTPSPDCYPSNPFPSPTTAPPPERFIPPPPLSPSPTEKFPPKNERFDGKRYQDRYTLSPNPEKYTSGQERYQQYSTNDPRTFQERYQCYPDRFNQYHAVQDRFGQTTEYRALPPTAHTPVERYVPQPQEPYYQGYQTYERYPKWNGNAGDPYMRRDLGYHHHYRLPVPFQQANYQRIRYNHVGTPSRVKCCQYQDFTLSKSSPGSSSSSSVTSQGKEIQAYIQNPGKDISCYHNPEIIQQPFHQEKGIQCVNFQGNVNINKDNLQCALGFGTNTVRASNKVPCKHVCSSPGVEYVGQAGGRVVCATPPPPRPASGGPEQCGDQCCLRRPQNTVLTTSTPAVW